MMGRVTRDGGRGLIVYDLYRFYRNLQGLLNHYQKLDESGVATGKTISAAPGTGFRLAFRGLAAPGRQPQARPRLPRAAMRQLHFTGVTYLMTAPIVTAAREAYSGGR